jgi:FkbM family methyltransferase
MGLKHSSAFAEAVARGLPQDEAFRLADIGWSSGLEAGWLGFGDHLRVLGVVALGGSVDAPDPRVRLLPRNLEPSAAALAPSPLDRLSVVRAQDLVAGGAEPLEVWFRRRLAQTTSAPGPSPGGHDLTSLIDAEGFGQADFLRIEAGQADFELLRGLQPLLARPSLLGVAVRVNFLGTGSPDENSFHNTDRLLRRNGFDLFVLEPVKYASAALPWPFLAAHPDATHGGRVIYAQAVYLRDLAQKEQRPVAESLPAAALAKAAAVRALFGLPDQAAELLLVDGDRLAPILDVAAGLDMLATEIQADLGTEFGSYRDYIDGFERAAPAFYDFGQRHHDWLMNLQAVGRRSGPRIQQLADLVRGLTARLHRADPAIAGFDIENAKSDVGRRSLIDPGQHWIFDHYAPYRGPAEGLHLDYIGTRTSGDFGHWMPPMILDHVESPYPDQDEEYFEWIDVLQAVLEAGDTFTMLELGAGYGRWSARGALAARRLGKAVRLGLAEAEPRHQAWLQRHLVLNGVTAAEYRLFGQAVGGKVGEVAFTIGKSDAQAEDNWFGQSAMPLDFSQNPPVGDYYGLPVYEQLGWRAILVPQIPLSDVLKAYDFIDLADFDLQGAEGEAIAEAADLLTRKVRRLHIGTHSEAIEKQLRDLLPRHGWVCLRDYSLHKTHDTPFGRCQFVDGVQSWINPARI